MQLTMSIRIVRPNLDSRLRQAELAADTMVHRDAADSVADSAVIWAEGVEVDDKSTSPTFVTSVPFPLLICGGHLY